MQAADLRLPCGGSEGHVIEAKHDAMTCRIALLQKQSLDRQPERSTELVIGFMREAAARNAALLLLPEAFLTGYELPMRNAKPFRRTAPSCAACATRRRCCASAWSQRPSRRERSSRGTVPLSSVGMAKSSYAQFMRISAHRGKKRAYVAVAHSMLVAIYHMLKDGVVFKDLGADYYSQFNKERKINAYLKKLEALGRKAPVVAA